MNERPTDSSIKEATLAAIAEAVATGQGDLHFSEVVEIQGITPAEVESAVAKGLEAAVARGNEEEARKARERAEAMGLSGQKIAEAVGKGIKAIGRQIRFEPPQKLSRTPSIIPIG